MKNIRIFLAAVLCVSLFAFAGCGSDDSDMNNTDNGTVTEETMDKNEDKSKDKDGSVTEDMADDAKDAIDDVEDAIDGNDATDKTKNSN